MENEGNKKRKGQKNNHGDEICNVVYWKQFAWVVGETLLCHWLWEFVLSYWEEHAKKASILFELDKELFNKITSKWARMKFHANQSDCWDNIEPLCTGRLMQQVVLRSLAQIHSDLNIPHAELSGVLDQAPLLLHMYRRESETLEFKFWALVMHILTSYSWILCGTWQNVETLTEIKEIVDPEMKILSWFNMLFQTSMTFFIIIVLWKTNKRLQKMNGTGCFPCMHNDWRLFVSLLNLKSIMIHHDYLCVIFPVFKE